MLSWKTQSEKGDFLNFYLIYNFVHITQYNKYNNEATCKFLNCCYFISLENQLLSIFLKMNIYALMSLFCYNPFKLYDNYNSCSQSHLSFGFVFGENQFLLYLWWYCYNYYMYVYFDICFYCMFIYFLITLLLLFQFESHCAEFELLYLCRVLYQSNGKHFGLNRYI